MFYSKSEEIAYSRLDGEICIFHPELGEYLNLNSTGSFIWELIDKGQDESYLIEMAYKSFKGDKDSIKKDVIEFLNKGCELKILNTSNV